MPGGSGEAQALGMREGGYISRVSEVLPWIPTEYNCYLFLGHEGDVR